MGGIQFKKKISKLKFLQAGICQEFKLLSQSVQSLLFGDRSTSHSLRVGLSFQHRLLVVLEMSKRSAQGRQVWQAQQTSTLLWQQLKTGKIIPSV